jgi:hypothetical protein
VSRKLIVNDGRRQRELLLVSKLVVGRDPTCDLSEADPLLSRRHAEFTVSGDDIVVRDLGSRNGIYVNGARVAESLLQSGDIIRIGHLQMRYLEDSAPLVSVPELADDATGLVIPGPRPGTPKPPTPPSMAAKPSPTPGSIARPAASGAIPRPAPPASLPRPGVSASQQRPVPVPPSDSDADVTSYVSPSSVRRSQIGVAPPSSGKIPAPPPAPRPASQTLAVPPPVAEDQSEQTRVVPAPGRSGVRPKPEPLEPAIGERTSVLPAPKSRTAVQPPAVQPPAVQAPSAPIKHTSVLPPPAPAQPVMATAVQAPPTPPAEDIDEPTSVLLTPRPGTRVGVPVAEASSANGREARALALAVEAIATFLGSAAIGRNAADAVKILEKDLASAGPPADLVAALKDLAARLTAAAHELT